MTLGGEGQLHYQVEQQARDDAGTFLDDTGKNGRPFQVGALYALADADLGARARLSLGARWDVYSTFGSSLNPRVALILKPYEAGNTKLLLAKHSARQHVRAVLQRQRLHADPEPESRPRVTVFTRSRTRAPLLGQHGGDRRRLWQLRRSSDLQRRRRRSGRSLHYENERSPLLVLGGEVGLRREFRQGAMFALSYGLSVGALPGHERRG